MSTSSNSEFGTKIGVSLFFCRVFCLLCSRVSIYEKSRPFSLIFKKYFLQTKTKRLNILSLNVKRKSVEFLKIASLALHNSRMDALNSGSPDKKHLASRLQRLQLRLGPRLRLQVKTWVHLTVL